MQVGGDCVDDKRASLFSCRATCLASPTLREIGQIGRLVVLCCSFIHVGHQSPGDVLVPLSKCDATRSKDATRGSWPYY